MPPACLTVLAPIKPGEVDALRAVLRPIGDDVGGRRLSAAARPRIAFPDSTGIHFARFAILSDPDRGPDRARLLYAAVYDGSIEAHAAELAALSSDLDAIWGRLEGYGGSELLATFLRAHAHDPAAYYIAFREETAESIKLAVAARESEGAGTGAPSLSTAEPVAERIAAALHRLFRAAPIVVDLVAAIGQHGFTDVYRGTLRILACLDRYPLFAFVNRITRNRMPARVSPFSSMPIPSCPPARVPLAPNERSSGLHPSFREDVVAQNQLTLVTEIEDGGTERVRAVMAAIDSYAKRLAPPGSLIGISTIHFVRWLVIDRGRRLMMLSDYDGSWENYIDEFAEMIVSGLDAIWETAPAFPPDGARDLPAFKAFLRGHQVPPEVFFSAYPNASVLNISRDLRARHSGNRRP